MVYRAELYPQVDLMIAVSINKLRLYQIVFVSILLAKIFTTKIKQFSELSNILVH